MKKYQYIIALSCVLVGAVGFSSMYLTNQAKEREAELAKQQQLVQESQQLELASNDKTEQQVEQEPTVPEHAANQIADARLNPEIQEEIEIVDDPLAEQDLANQRELEKGQVADAKNDEETNEPETVVGTIVEEKLSFHPEKGRCAPGC